MTFINNCNKIIYSFIDGFERTDLFMAMKITRREAREHLLGLVYETEFRTDDDKEVILTGATEERDVPDDKFIKSVFFGICENLEQIDALIEKNSVGWKTERMSRVSRAILRLGTYELKFADDIPSSVTINEAVELAKKYDDDKAKAFINGILNAIKNEVGEKK